MYSDPFIMLDAFLTFFNLKLITDIIIHQNPKETYN